MPNAVRISPLTGTITGQPLPVEYGAGKQRPELVFDSTTAAVQAIVPRHHWKDSHEFAVAVRICVAASGLVHSATALEYSHRPVADALVNAVMGWRYQPLRVNGVRRSFCYVQPIRLVRR